MATQHQPQTPQFYMDEKWKLSKRESLSRKESLSRSRSLASTASTTTTKPTTHFMRSSSTSAAAAAKRRCAFTRKCATLVKEQRARFYIMRRCVTMLICWRDYGDSDSGFMKKSVVG